eukprot:6076126-Pleurochrysis_carterae.AAC.3
MDTELLSSILHDEVVHAGCGRCTRMHRRLFYEKFKLPSNQTTVIDSKFHVAVSIEKGLTRDSSR